MDTTPSKKGGKKGKAKAKKAEPALDDVDQALAELSTKYVLISPAPSSLLTLIRYPELRNITTPIPGAPSSSTPTQQSLATLLSVSLPHLDAEAEMRKFFGAKVVSASKSSNAGPSVRRGLAQKSNLTKPKPAWWNAAQREGLSIRLLTDDELRERRERHGLAETGQGSGGEKIWTVEYSKKYKSMTHAFIQTVMSGGASRPIPVWLIHDLA